MDEMKSKVYILTDERGRIIRCEGGYTMSNIDDVSQWTLIDEGEGDRFNLCQSHYFAGGLTDDNGVPLWELRGDSVRLRSAEDVAADVAALPEPSESKTLEARVEDLEADTVTLAEAMTIAFGGTTDGRNN